MLSSLHSAPMPSSQACQAGYSFGALYLLCPLPGMHLSQVSLWLPPDLLQGPAQMSSPEEASSDPLPNKHPGHLTSPSSALFSFTALVATCPDCPPPRTPASSGVVSFMAVPPAPKTWHIVGAQKVIVGGVSEQTKMQSRRREVSSTSALPAPGPAQ